MPDFSHLHVHTQFSLLDGAASIPSLYKKAVADGMPALAITDHGNMFGVFEFVSQAYKHRNDDGSLKVKPIIGCEFYVVEDRTRKTFTKEQKDQRYHQVLLAKNSVGYQNLIKLTSLGYIEGLYSKYPRIDKQLIERYHEGLIATTCCLGAYVPQTILKAGEDEAEKEFKWWLNLFGEDFYIEIQRHNIKEQEQINTILLKFSKKYNVPVIATNDSHYTDREDYNAHDILLCINTGEKKSTPGYDDFVNDDVNLRDRRFKFPNDQFYFKTKTEMIELFRDIPESIDNTNRIVDKVEVLNLKKDILLPNFPIPTEFQLHGDAKKNQFEYLRHLSFEGAKMRYNEVTDEIRERLDFELFTIETMGFAGYFLIVSDFIKAGRELNVFVGPGRGSAAGSVVAYCIGITNIDPIKYNLLFERFLNPDRKSMPDIDTDFDDEGRQKVIDYVVKKYGQNQVAQIITYGTMAAKMSIKDVARTLDLPLAEANLLAKMVPDKPGIELKNVLHAPLTSKDGDKSLEEKYGVGPDDIETVKKLRVIYSSDTLAGEVLHEAERLEGSVRNTGIHAAGIIIAPTDLTELIPVCTAKDSELWVTQIEGSIIEDAGVIKMDFLGLKTLSILKNALALIEQHHEVKIDIDNIPLDDEKTFLLYQRGDTIGTFQFESPGMQKYLRELKPDSFNDLIAMNALYRPGPIAYIPNYINRKHGREEIAYDLPELEEVLKDTYGITVYQEQVMILAQVIGGFSKGDADMLRKAMGKKQKSVLDKMKAQFIAGAKGKGHPEEILNKIWTDWEAFAQYAFNKSHSTCYALVAYQTAYLKAHYPAEYMAAVLNNSTGNIDKMTFFMEESKRMGKTVLGPDINESDKGFTVNNQGLIRFGLGGLKGVGEAAVEAIIQERAKNGAYTSIFDLVQRTNQRTVNKKTLESLCYAGAFDTFPDLHRAQYFYQAPGDNQTNLEKIIRFGSVYQASMSNASNTLFGDMAMPEVETPRIPACEPWPLITLLGYEKEVTGMFMSGHPLDNFRFEIDHYGLTKLHEFAEIKDEMNPQQAGRSFRLAGLVVDAQHRVTKTGRQFGSFTLEDYSGKAEFMLWSDDYTKFSHYLEKGNNLFLTGSFKMRYNNTDIEFKVEKLFLLESIKQQLTKQLVVDLQAKDLRQEDLDFLTANLKKFPGKAGIKFNITDPEEDCRLTLYSLATGLEMNDELANWLHKKKDWEIQIQSN